MALTSTLHHFELHLSHVDRGIDEALVLKAARHPSETVERLWLRVLALAWQWQERIAFGPGLCELDAPDVLATGLDGTTTLLVRVGKPEPERIARDVAQNGRAKVAVLFESPRRMDAFLADARDRKLARAGQAELAALEPSLLAAVSQWEDRRIRASLTLVSDHLYLERDGQTVDGPLLRGSLG